MQLIWRAPIFVRCTKADLMGPAFVLSPLCASVDVVAQMHVYSPVLIAGTIIVSQMHVYSPFLVGF